MYTSINLIFFRPVELGIIPSTLGLKRPTLSRKMKRDFPFGLPWASIVNDIQPCCLFHLGLSVNTIERITDVKAGLGADFTVFIYSEQNKIVWVGMGDSL